MSDQTYWYHPNSPYYDDSNSIHPEEDFTMTAKNTEIVAVPEEITEKFNMCEAMADELEGYQLNFVDVKVPAGGSLAFEICETNGDAEMIKELTGVVVDHHPVNAYWPNSFDGNKVKPDCTAFDGIVGQGSPGGACATCKLNQFGSHPNGGKACKNMYRVYLLREGEAFPLRLNLPPSSIVNFRKYLQSLLTKKLRSFGVTTKIFLKKVQNPNGIVYSQGQFALESVLSPSETKDMNDFRIGIRTVTRFNPTQELKAGETIETETEAIPF